MRRRAANWKFAEFPEMAHEARYGIVAAVIGAGVLGAGASVYGSSQQSSASNAANAANQQNVTNANNASWTDYLMERGINPGGPQTYGVIPANAAPVNTKLPLWATLDVPNSVAGQAGSAIGPAAGSKGAGAGYAPAGQQPISAAAGSGGMNPLTPAISQTPQFSPMQPSNSGWSGQYSYDA